MRLRILKPNDIRRLAYVCPGCGCLLIVERARTTKDLVAIVCGVCKAAKADEDTQRINFGAIFRELDGTTDQNIRFVLPDEED